MRKVLLMITLGVLCVVYFFSVRNRAQQEVDIFSDKINVLLAQTRNELQENYPQTIEGVLEVNNQIMRYEYNEQMKVEWAKDAVDTTRMLYSQKLLSLNPVEAQIEGLVKEIQTDSGNRIYLLSSKIGAITYMESKAEELEEAEAKVVHYTTGGDIHRTYFMIKEGNEWKIHSFKDDPIATDKQ